MIKGDMFMKRLRSSFIVSLSVVLALLLAPSTAFASTLIKVDGTEYTQAASGKGSKGGTWEWDGADLFSMDNYNGGRIVSDGALDIVLTGNNIINYNGSDDGNSALLTGTEHGGALTIEGEGELTVNFEVEKEQVAVYGIYSYGDLNVNDTTVNVEMKTKEDVNTAVVGTFSKDATHVNGSQMNISCNGSNGSQGMSTNGGVEFNGSNVDLSVTGADVGDGSTVGVFTTGFLVRNGSNVTMKAQGSRDTYGVYNQDSGAFLIDGSTVSVSGVSSGGNGFGMISESMNPASSSHMVIKNSTVNASGSTAALWSFGSAPGHGIELIESIIKSPQGGVIQDIEIETDKYPNSIGQVIGTGKHLITSWDDPAIVKAVEIGEVAPSPTPAPTPVPHDDGSAYANALAKTGDAGIAQGLLGLMALTAAGGLLVALAFRRRSEK